MYTGGDVKELRMAMTQEELKQVLEYRDINLKRASSNRNENTVFNALPKQDQNGETLVWERQYVFGYRIFDFYCQQRKIVVEVDGDEHNKEYDSYRDEYLFRVYGIVTLRVRNKNTSDLNSVLKVIPAVGKSPYGKRNLLFKDILGSNSSHVDREKLAIAIPFDDEHNLMGRFLLSRGYKSEYQKFNNYSKRHWLQIIKKYSGVVPRTSDKNHFRNLLHSLGMSVVKVRKDYLFDPEPSDLSNFRKWKTVNDRMVVLFADMSYSVRGKRGVGLQCFLNEVGYDGDYNLIVRAKNTFREADNSVTLSRAEGSITLKEYVDARCGKLPKALTTKEARLFGASLEKGWYKKYADVEAKLEDVVQCVKGILTSTKVTKTYRINLKRYFKMDHAICP